MLLLLSSLLFLFLSFFSAPLCVCYIVLFFCSFVWSFHSFFFLFLLWHIRWIRDRGLTNKENMGEGTGAGTGEGMDGGTVVGSRVRMGGTGEGRRVDRADREAGREVGDRVRMAGGTVRREAAGRDRGPGHTAFWPKPRRPHGL